MYKYYAFGLNISSDVYFPELLPLPLEQTVTTYDLTIQSQKINPNGLPAAVDQGLYFQTAPQQFWMHVPDTAWFEVKDGRTIRYQLAQNGDEQTMRLFLLGSCFGALLHQRKLLVMHGNAIRFGDQCVMFAGPSGNGKSTLAAAFYKRGFEILSDDVCAIDGQHQVIPGYPQLKLWQDTIKKLALDLDSMRQIRLQIEKYALKIDNQFCRRPLPLTVTYFLSTHNLDTFDFENLSGMETFLPLRNNTYRIRYLKGMKLDAEHLQRIGSLSRQARVTRITRPNSDFRLDEMLDAIIDDLALKGVQPGVQP